jgi:UDP-glucose 4-epimerase
MYSAVIPKWILAAFKKEPLIIFGDGEQKRDFTFINDVTDIFKKSIKESHISNDPINLAFGKSVTLNDILKSHNVKGVIGSDAFNNFVKNYYLII